MIYVELIGYLASLLTALAMSLGNIKLIRVVSFFGSITFFIYGLIISAYPIVALNLYLMTINLYHLYRISRSKDYFNINETLTKEDYFLNRFLDFYKEDIDIFFPNFKIDEIIDPKIILVSRNMNPVGMFIYETKKDGIIEIHLDYARKEYRDLKNIRYTLLEKSDDFRSRGYKSFMVKSAVKEHQRYIQKVGFKAVSEQSTEFILDI